MTDTDQPPAGAKSRAPTLMGVVNARVAQNAAPGSNAHSGWLAAVRAAITPAGEGVAVSQTAPWLVGMGTKRRSAELRAAAIRAINKDVRQASQATEGYLSLGRSFSRLDALEGGSSVAQQVAVLPLLNVDAAALVLNGLIGRCAAHGIPVNFYNLADTLVRWGNGSSASSVRGRNRIVLDFYLHADAPTAFASLPTESD